METTVEEKKSFLTGAYQVQPLHASLFYKIVWPAELAKLPSLAESHHGDDTLPLSQLAEIFGISGHAAN